MGPWSREGKGAGFEGFRQSSFPAMGRAEAGIPVEVAVIME